MDTIKIGKFLASLRKEAGLTQEKLGEKLGVTNKTVSRWETGTYLPDIEMLCLLSEFYGVSINELLSGERLGDSEFREKADQNIQNAYRNKRRFVRRTVLVCCAVVLLLALIVGSVGGIVTYRNMENYIFSRLYPYGKQNDDLFSFQICDTIRVDRRTPSETQSFSAEKGITVSFEVPVGFTEHKMDGNGRSVMFTEEKTEGASKRFFVIRADDYSGWQRPFALDRASTPMDYILYALQYDAGRLNEVTPQSASWEIDKAGAIRKLRHIHSLTNTEGKTGLLYPLSGDSYGYILTPDVPGDGDHRIWLIALEYLPYEFFIMVSTSPDAGEVLPDLIEWIRAISFSAVPGV